MPGHHRMFFATGDYICDEKTGLSVVEHNNIFSTAFVVPALTPATISDCKSTRETVEAMENTDYYIALLHYCISTITKLMEIDWLGYSFKYNREVALIVTIQIIANIRLQHLITASEFIVYLSL